MTFNKSFSLSILCSLASIILFSYGVNFGYGAPSLPSEEDGQRQILALTYPEGPTLSVKMGSTFRLPRASGEAKVERKKGITEIEIELDEMKPATGFGGDFNTYLLWVVSPEGHVDNLGEFILQGNRSKLNVSTPLETFGMFVSAEPHFLVDRPSRFVVLENTRPVDHVSLMTASTVDYIGFEGLYAFRRETLANLPEGSGEIRTHFQSARTAVDLARRAGAERFAPDELAQAEEALRRAAAAAELRAGDNNRMLTAHETIRLAVRASKIAQERSFQAALESERQAHAAQIDTLEESIQQAQGEAERARLEAERKQLEAEMEERARMEAQQRADEMARQARRAEERAREMAAAKAEAETEAARAEQSAQQARREAEQALQEKEEARARLMQAMTKVTEVRETARGILINLPDILFDYDKASLKPQAREILAKLSGILQVVDGYTLNVAGHTDSTGSEQYNLKLSRQRAQSVQSYLTEQGIPAGLVEIKAWGESQPVASNDTAEGRQKNRRVEILVQETAQFGLTSGLN